MIGKFYTVKFGPMLIYHMDEIINVYTANAETTSRKRASLLQSRSKLTILVLSLGFMGYVSIGLFHFINPIYEYLWHNELKPLMPTYLPFIDEKTTSGFIILTINQMIGIFYAVLGSYCADILGFVLVLNFSIFTTVFRENTDEFNGILHQRNGETSSVKEKFRTIFDQYEVIWM